MGIQNSINAVLGSVAGGMTLGQSVVGKAKNMNDESVAAQANTRAKAIYLQRKQRRNVRGQFQTGYQFKEVTK